VLLDEGAEPLAVGLHPSELPEVRAKDLGVPRVAPSGRESSPGRAGLREGEPPLRGRRRMIVLAEVELRLRAALVLNVPLDGCRIDGVRRRDVGALGHTGAHSLA
jgi:hypothetical protein